MPLGNLLGLPIALLGCLWTRKTLKNIRFSKVFANAVFGSFKLLVALLGSSWPLLGSIWSKDSPQNGPTSGPKVGQKLSKELPPKI